MGLKRRLTYAAVAASTLASTAAGAAFCGRADEPVPKGLLQTQVWKRPLPSALTTHCNGACAAGQLCVFRDDPQVCASTTPTCVRGTSCAYECISTTITAAYPLRWSIEGSADGGAAVHTVAIAPTATPDPSSTSVRLVRRIDRIDHLELPGNTIELSIRSVSPIVLERDASALASYNALVRLDIVDVDVRASWPQLPSMNNLKTLSLANASLDQWPLPVIGGAPLTLQTLNLQRNPGLLLLPGALPGQLRTLNVAECGLTYLPSILIGVPSLHELTVDGNPLAQSLREISSLPPRLKSLSARACRLTTIPLGLSTMQHLLTVDLGQNPQLGSSPISSADLPFTSLLSLTLDGCGIAEFPFDALWTAPLTSLNLSGNPLAASTFDLFTSTGSVQEMDLSSTGLQEIPSAVAASATLHTLNVAGNRLQRLPQWSPASALRRLNVSGNANIQIDSAPPTLQEFDASNCSLSSLPVLSLFNWSALTLLDLSSNGLTSLEDPARNSSFNFSALAPHSSSSSADPPRLCLNLSGNALSRFPSALLHLAPFVRQLDLRGNPFDPPLRLTSHEAAFLAGLDEVRVDATALAVDCSSKKTLRSGQTLCLNDSPATVRPFDGVDGGRAATAESPGTPDTNPDAQSTASSRGSDRSAIVTTASVASVLIGVIAVTLVITYRKTGPGEDAAVPTLHIAVPPGRLNHNGVRPRGRTRGNTRGRDFNGSILSSGVVFPSIQPAPARSTVPVVHNVDDEFDDDDEDLAVMLTSDSAVPTMDAAAACLLEDITDDLDFIAWRLRPQHIKLGPHVATGTSCFVYMARLAVVDADARTVRTHRVVAVKKLPPHQTYNDVDSIDRLAREVRVLAPFQHPKIVQFLGVSWTQRLDLQIVLEWMPDGDLRTLLGHHAATVGTPPVVRWVIDDAAEAEPSPGRALRFALDVAEALVYVHSVGPHLHRQRRHWRLSSHKVLLDGRRDVAKLSDFGSSAKDQREVFLHMRRWIAPEVLAGDASEDADAALVRADMYAFGILLAELDTFDLPFARVLRDTTAATATTARPEFPSEKELLRAIVRADVDDLRPLLLTATCPAPVAELVHWCTQRDPAARPTATQLAQRLRRFAALVGGRRESVDSDAANHTNRASEVQVSNRATHIYYLDPKDDVEI